MRKSFTFLLLIFVSPSYSQDWPVKKEVMNKKALNVPFTKVAPFRFIANKPLTKQGTYQLLKLSPSFNSQLMTERPAALQLSVPLSSSTNITFDLVQFSIGYVHFTENNGNTINDIKIPLTYRGIIAGEKRKNTVTLTVNDEYLSLTAGWDSNAIMITKADEKDSLMYRVYDNNKIQFPSGAGTFSCGNVNEKISESLSGIDLTGGSSPTALQDKCVNLFIDCFDSLYLNRSSSKQATVSFVYELMNAVITGYLKEQINMQVATINIWTVADPFTGTTREARTRKLADYWKDNFWGNICVGLDFSPTAHGGLADGIGIIKGAASNTCPAYTDTTSAVCYNDLTDGAVARNFPVGPNTNHSQIYLVMHEIGHKLGSRHTKWCGWKLTSNPDTFGAIDSCSTPEGMCAKGPPPVNGGTIMSYCFNNPSFINYDNGFGPLPGNVIRTFVEQATCIINCINCFGLLRKEDNNLSLAVKANSNGEPKKPIPIAIGTKNTLLPLQKK